MTNELIFLISIQFFFLERSLESNIIDKIRSILVCILENMNAFLCFLDLNELRKNYFFKL